MAHHTCSAGSRRVVVTGLGLRTSTLSGVEAFWARLHGGAPAVPVPAAEELASRLPHVKVKFLDETATYALLAAMEALTAAGLDVGVDGSPANDDIGMAIGTLSGPIKWGFESGYIDASVEWDNPPISPASSVVAYYGSLIGNVAIPLRLAGPAQIFCNLDVGGTDAIGYAYDVVRHGKSPVMLAGGADAPVTPMVEAALEGAGVLLRGRGSTCLLPGAAFAVLEDWDHARARGAPILAEVLGYETSASGSDAERGVVDRIAVGARIDCVVTTGVASHETELLRTMFGSGATPPVTRVSRAAGFAAAASGGVQAVAAVKLLGARRIPAGRGAGEYEDLACRDSAGLDCEVSTVLQTSAGLSRQTSLLLFSQAEAGA